MADCGWLNWIPTKCREIDRQVAHVPREVAIHKRSGYNASARA